MYSDGKKHDASNELSLVWRITEIEITALDNEFSKTMGLDRKESEVVLEFEKC